MKRDTLFALVVALLLHGIFFGGGEWLKKSTPPVPVSARDEVVPVIELVAIPAVESGCSPSAVAPVAEVVPVEPPPLVSPAPLVNDVPVVPPISPPPFPGLGTRGEGIVIPAGRVGHGGPEGGVGQGLGNFFNLADLDQPPSYTLRVRPTYPYDMRRAGVSGEVVVGFVVDSTGRVRDAYAIRSSRPEFADEAIKAVQQWQFKPGRRGGVPVSTRLQVLLIFNLQSN